MVQLVIQMKTLENILIIKNDRINSILRGSYSNLQ